MEGNHRFNIEEMNIAGLIEAIRSRSVTSKELVSIYLERIARLDKDGPRINSVAEINPDALHIAEALDRNYEMNGPVGPLHGIPILIKDNINTGDNMHTTAGSLALADNYARGDAFIVKRLRAAGAVILGKTNLTEFANFMTENMPNGYSSRGGQVLNPYGAGRFDVGGSSSGSGAAAACCFCAGAIGTETSGSILSPACCNSTVGIKPTVGLVSRSGIVPIAYSQDTAGPIARTVADAALLLGAITGEDDDDPITLAGCRRSYMDYTKYLDKDGLSGARIGIPRDYFYNDLSQEQIVLAENAVKALKELGAVVVDPADIPSAREFDGYDVLVYEFKSAINAYLARNNVPSVRNLADIIHFNRTIPEEALRYGQTILEKCQETKGTLAESAYVLERLRDMRLSQKEGIDMVLDRYKLDAVVFPRYSGCDIAARAGYPSIIVPAGYTGEGEPFGITFTSGAYTEPQLITYAYAYEQGTKKRKPPVLL
ncbi:MAG TPA: amidase family protein [Clostridia bacterium]|nr:amidase family protein [Clostridia bacterium]